MVQLYAEWESGTYQVPACTFSRQSEHSHVVRAYEPARIAFVLFAIIDTSMHHR